jgi:hypothetical protein
MLIESVFQYRDILGMAETVQMQGQGPGWILSAWWSAKCGVNTSLVYSS